MAYTTDQVALAIINEGLHARTDGTDECQHPPLTAKGIQIALATAIVESGLRVLANPAVPESETYPHDGDGYDHYSAGPFGQQYMWWGTVAEEMDPSLSAAMFYHQLARERIGQSDYNTDAASPGGWAQMVQQSAFPTRYDGVWGQAVALYNRLVSIAGGTQSPVPVTSWFQEFNIIDGYPNFQPRNGQKPRLFVLHTEEGGLLGRDLANWMINAEVSYHYVVDEDGTVYDLVDTDDAAWSVADANDFTINLVFAGSTINWSRQDWLSNMSNGIKIAAYLAVQDCRKYGIPIQLLVGNDYSKLKTTNGITDHHGINVGLGITNHTDCGSNFPWDVFNQYLQQFAAGTPAVENGFLMALTDDQQQQLFDRTNQIWGALFNPVESTSIYRDPNPPGGIAPGNLWATKDLIHNDDGMDHEEWIEESAIKGDQDSLMRLTRAAAGQGADTSAAAVTRAIGALKAVPADVLSAFEAAQAAEAVDNK